jgi:hypothetical protein
VNAVITDMASYAEANAQLLTAPKKKVQVNKFLHNWTLHWLQSALDIFFFIVHVVGRKSLGKSSGE